MFLARLAGLLKKEDPESIALELESAFHSFLGLPRSLVLRMDAEGLIRMFSVTGEQDADRIVMAGLLLRQESLLSRRLGFHEESQAQAERSAHLLDVGLAGAVSPELRRYLEQETGGDGAADR